jgi:hypothetical protein
MFGFCDVYSCNISEMEIVPSVKLILKLTLNSYKYVMFISVVTYYSDVN